MIATKSAGHMQVGGWISRWSRWPPVCPICPLHLLFPLGAIPGHQGEMSRKIRFYYVFSTLGFWTGEFPQHFHKNPLLQKKKVPTRKGGGQNSGPLLRAHPRRTSYVAAGPGPSRRPQRSITTRPSRSSQLLGLSISKQPSGTAPQQQAARQF